MIAQDLIHTMCADAEGDIRVMENGARLLVHTPHVAPRAYLHSIFPPLSSIEIFDLDVSVGEVLSEDYRTLLSESNGLELFSNALSIYGLVTENRRSVDAVLKQPFDIVSPNVDEYPRFAAEGHCIIGSFKTDGSLILTDILTPSIVRVDRDAYEELNRWECLRNFLTSEYRRMSKLFDTKGHRYSTEVPTAPIRVQ